MKTKDILAALRKNKIISQIVPEWACRSVPFPFFQNGVPYLGLYFFPVRRKPGETRLFAPVLQFVLAHKDGRIVSAVASPYFLHSGENGSAEIGTYPNPAMKALSFADAEKTYDRYYESCDRYLEGGAEEDWRKMFESVGEPGLESFFARFSNVNTAAGPGVVAVPSGGQPSNERASRPKDVCQDSDVHPTAANAKTVRNVSPVDLDAIIGEFRRLLADSPFKSRLEDLKKAMVSFRRSRFNVAVVGEFSRGKSTFINELVGNGPLPTGDLPTTAVPARIVGGETRKAVFLENGKPPRVLDCTQEALSAFAADADGRDPNGALELQIDDDWLRTAPVALFDTPGVGDSVGDRAQLARATIACCDCTIVAVSAKAPCSLTELSFIRDGVIAKKVPCVAVLVTKMDTIPEAERADVVAFIRDKIKPVAPEAELWLPRPLPGLTADCADCIGLDTIRKRISRFASDPEIVSARLRQKAEAVSDVISAVSGDMTIAEQANALSKEKRAEVARKISEKKQSFKLFCDELFVECERGQVSTAIWTREELSKIRAGLVEDFVHSMRVYRGDLKKWAEEEFPYQAKREIPRRVRDQFGPKLEARLAAFATKLAKMANESISSSDFAMPAFSFGNSAGLGGVVGINVDDRDVRRIQTGSTIAKVAAVPVAMLGLLLVGGPVGLAYGIGAAATAGAGFLGGKLAEEKTGDLKTELEHRVEYELKRIFDEQANKAAELVEKAFGQIRSMMQTRLQASIDSALATLNADNDESTEHPVTDLSGFRTKLDEIRKRILRSSNS